MIEIIVLETHVKRIADDVFRKLPCHLHPLYTKNQNKIIITVKISQDLMPFLPGENTKIDNFWLKTEEMDRIFKKIEEFLE